ncbi:hypothetical protein ATPR_3321 [Acetobacter tropicalis NBRC 101654]|uniref:Uncharacterized protein n=1 Tax=Acetobacter tropicalis NBRC 101654 TaxID=749388 RepID=F7VIX2_9PROT|nr:hypothetical protein ATPR_3321 [Acetobacter tropicalis NBRC 101654]
MLRIIIHGRFLSRRSDAPQVSRDAGKTGLSHPCGLNPPSPSK